ncbi:hypothetical protein [Acuticoccus sp.]
MESIKSFRDLANNHLEARVKSTLIDYGDGNTIFLRGVDASLLTGDDFIF